MILALLSLATLASCSYQIRNLTRTYIVGDSTELTEQATLRITRVKEDPTGSFVYGISSDLINEIGFVQANYGEDTSGALLATEILPTTGNTTGIKISLLKDRADNYSGSIPDNFFLHIHIVYPRAGKLLNVVATPAPSEEILLKQQGKNPATESNHAATLKLTVCAELPSFYPCSKQKTAVKFGSSKTSFIAADIDSRDYKVIKTSSGTAIVITPKDYAPENECTPMKLKYYSNAYQLEVTAVRTVLINGPILKTSTSQSSFIVIRDDFTVRNLNPWSSEANFGNRDVLLQQHYTKTIPQYLEIDLSCAADENSIAYFDRIGKIDTIEVLPDYSGDSSNNNNNSNKTTIRIRPRFALMGQNKTMFTLKYTCRDVYSLQPKESGQEGEKRTTYGLSIPVGSRISHAHYDAFTVCIYPPSGAANARMHAPFIGSASNNSHASYAGVLDTQDRVGGCVSTGLSTNEKVTLPIFVEWAYNTKKMLIKKIIALATNILIIASVLSAVRATAGK